MERWSLQFSGYVWVRLAAANSTQKENNAQKSTGSLGKGQQVRISDCGGRTCWKAVARLWPDGDTHADTAEPLGDMVCPWLFKKF